MKRNFILGFLAGSVLFALPGLLVVNQLLRMHHSLAALSAGSNIYAAMAADLQTGNIERAMVRLKTLAWEDRQNGRYSGCMTDVRWHLLRTPRAEGCADIFETPMPSEWQIPGVEKVLQHYSSENQLK